MRKGSKLKLFVDLDNLRSWKIKERSSYEERTEDDLASGAEEGRDKLRKATGRRK